MKRILIAAFLAFSLIGCAGTRVGDAISVVSSFSVSQNQVDALRSSYNAAFLVPAAHYRQLPRCTTGGSAVCRKPNLVRQLQAIDRAVLANFTNVQLMIDSGQSQGLSAAWGVLEEAVSSAKQFIVSNGLGA